MLRGSLVTFHASLGPLPVISLAICCNPLRQAEDGRVRLKEGNCLC